MSSERPARDSTSRAAPRAGACRDSARVRGALAKRFFIAPVGCAAATSLVLLLEATPSHSFYVLWGSVILIGASHGSLGQGLAAGVSSSILLWSFRGNCLVVMPAEPGAIAQAFAFLVFAVWAGRLNASRVREMRAAYTSAAGGKSVSTTSARPHHR
jgi:hypothetical protein